MSGIWQDLLIALGLVFVIEGLAYAIAPVAMRRVLAMAVSQSPENLRLMGLIGAVVGVFIVWLVS